jgi:hypothetical protein
MSNQPLREQPIILSVMMHGSSDLKLGRGLPKVRSNMDVVFFASDGMKAFWTSADQVYKEYVKLGRPKNKATILGFLEGMVFAQKDPDTNKTEATNAEILNPKDEYDNVVLAYHGMLVKKDKATNKKIETVPKGVSGESAFKMAMPYGLIEGIPKFSIEEFTEKKFLDHERIIKEAMSDDTTDTFINKKKKLMQNGGTVSAWKHLYAQYIKAHPDDVYEKYTSYNPNHIIYYDQGDFDFNLQRLLDEINTGELIRSRDGSAPRTFIILVYSCRAFCAS